MNKIPTLSYLLSRMELNSKNETKNLKANYIQTNNWQDDFLPLKNNLESHVQIVGIMFHSVHKIHVICKYV